MSDQDSVRIVYAMAHPVRLQLLRALCAGEECVCHLTALLGKRQAYVSQQLATLRTAGLISERKEGLRVYYRLRNPHLSQVLNALDAATGTKDTPVVRRRIATCHCPNCQPNDQIRENNHSGGIHAQNSSARLRMRKLP